MPYKKLRENRILKPIYCVEIRPMPQVKFEDQQQSNKK